jgi:hypothetical protein
MSYMCGVKDGTGMLGIDLNEDGDEGMEVNVKVGAVLHHKRRLVLPSSTAREDSMPAIEDENACSES